MFLWASIEELVLGVRSGTPQSAEAERTPAPLYAMRLPCLVPLRFKAATGYRHGKRLGKCDTGSLSDLAA